MPQGVGAVGRQAHFQGVVRLPAQVIGERLAYGGVRAQNPDAVVGSSQAQFVFRAQHALGNFAANLAFLDVQGFGGTGGVEGATYGGYGYFLAHGHVGGTANNVQGSIRAHGNRGQAQSVRVGVLLHREHFAHHHAAQTAGNAFNSFGGFDFQTRRRQVCRGLSGRWKRKYVGKQLLEPSVGNGHAAKVRNRLLNRWVRSSGLKVAVWLQGSVQKRSIQPKAQKPGQRYN